MAPPYDVVVVGSGFGGGIAACRLAEAGKRVCVLERGRRFGRDDFIDDPDQVPEILWHEKANPRGLFDVRLLRDVSVITAAGVGGGSLIYANVQLRAPADVFETGWPAAITRAELDPWYDRTEEALRAAHDAGGPGAAQGERVRGGGPRRGPRGGAAADRGALRRAARAPVLRRPAGGLPEPRPLRPRLPGARQEHRRHHLPRARRDARGRGPPAAPRDRPRAARARGGRWRVALPRPRRQAARAASRRPSSCSPPGRSGRRGCCSRTSAGSGLSPALGSRFSGNGDALGIAFDPTQRRRPRRPQRVRAR